MLRTLPSANNPPMQCALILNIGNVSLCNTTAARDDAKCFEDSCISVKWELLDTVSELHEMIE